MSRMMYYCGYTCIGRPRGRHVFDSRIIQFVVILCTAVVVVIVVGGWVRVVLGIVIRFVITQWDIVMIFAMAHIVGHMVVGLRGYGCF